MASESKSTIHQWSWIHLVAHLSCLLLQLPRKWCVVQKTDLCFSPLPAKLLSRGCKICPLVLKFNFDSVILTATIFHFNKLYLFRSFHNFFFFFFFEIQCEKLYYEGRKLLSRITKLVTSLWMSSNQICGSYKNFASFASLSATVFPFRLTCEKDTLLNLVASLRESSMMWLKAVVQVESETRCL